ncbi:cation:proton antiporter [Haliovirga abyssi]|uniref:Na+/H+ antiporter GerT n=1 Tax=Haliovirga abyssi TaxID=2996794 RepID=A0AAU9E425_9FUSO|nr:cation:proton antiporter [Haliovirga abyssi]BDU51240.1 Na+/H+ antiporter GerT [Haliovirga abyssi]
MEISQHLLAHVAIIIILAKIFSGISTKYKQPPVVGMLLIGLLIGPTGFDLIKTNVIIEFFSEIGVILLLFEAGLETDMEGMKKSGKSALIISTNGVIVPFISGILLAKAFHMPLNEVLVIGVIMTATSVSVTVMTLLDMKKFRTVEGMNIMGAAILDDVIGIILLTFIFSFLGQGDKNAMGILGDMVIYVAIASFIAFFVLNKVFEYSRKSSSEDTEVSMGLALSFLYSWGAKISGMAAITGSYFAGLAIGQTKSKNKVDQGIKEIGQSIFVPMFFINIGLTTNLRNGKFNLYFALIFVLVAMISKIVGGSLGAKFSGFNIKRSVAIGIGLVPRGEVALVVANMAMAKHIIGDTVFGAVVLMVIVSAITTPFMLKAAFKN